MPKTSIKRRDFLKSAAAVCGMCLTPVAAANIINTQTTDTVPDLRAGYHNWTLTYKFDVTKDFLRRINFYEVVSDYAGTGTVLAQAIAQHFTCLGNVHIMLPDATITDFEYEAVKYDKSYPWEPAFISYVTNYHLTFTGKAQRTLSAMRDHGNTLAKLMPFDRDDCELFDFKLKQDLSQPLSLTVHG